MSTSESIDNINTVISSSVTYVIRRIFPVAVVWCSMIGLLTFGVAVRVYFTLCERKRRRGVQESRVTVVQDCILVAIWTVALVEVVMVFVVLQYEREVGIRTHNPIDEYLFRFTAFLKMIYILAMINVVCLWLTKVPLYVLYVHFALKGILSKPLRVVTFCGAAYHALSFFVVFFMTLFACGPSIEDNWNIIACNSWNGFLQPIPMMVHLAFSSSSDIILMSIGIAMILAVRRGSTRPLREFVAIVFTFCIGLLSLTATIVRFSQLYTLICLAAEKKKVPVSFKVIDPALQWSSIETMSAIVACNLPSFREQLGKIRAPWKRRIKNGPGAV